MRVEALRYLSGFCCTAQLCPDTCCAGMRVTLTRADVDRLERALATSGEGRAELRELIATTAEPDRAGDLVRRPDGSCGFLRPDLLCSLISRAGAASVPDACALFPRSLSYFAGRVEVAASLSCPEAARLCLQGGGLELVEVPAEVASRIPEAPPPPPEDVYSGSVEEVRGALVEILRASGVPLAARLARIADVAERIGPFFHRGAAPLDDRGRALLGHALQTAADPAALSAVWDRLRESPGGGAPVAQALFGVLTSLQGSGAPRYQALLTAVLGVYHQRARAKDASFGARAGDVFAALWSTYGDLREQAAALGPALDEWLARYCENECHRDWYTRSPSLLAWAFQLSMKAAALAVALVAHPSIEALCAHLSAGRRRPTAEELGHAGQAAVETVQILLRRLERDPLLFDVLDRHLSPESLGTDGLGRAMLFARALLAPGGATR